jgi:hypothetical protein
MTMITMTLDEAIAHLFPKMQALEAFVDHFLKCYEGGMNFSEENLDALIVQARKALKGENPYA